MFQNLQLYLKLVVPALNRKPIIDLYHFSKSEFMVFLMPIANEFSEDSNFSKEDVYHLSKIRNFVFHAIKAKFFLC